MLPEEDAMRRAWEIIHKEAIDVAGLTAIRRMGPSAHRARRDPRAAKGHWVVEFEFRHESDAIEFPASALVLVFDNGDAEIPPLL